LKKILVPILAMIVIQPVAVEAQNVAVKWSALSGGFTLTTAQAGRMLMMSEGQTFVERASGSLQVVESGFLIHPFLRDLIVAAPEDDVLPRDFSLEQNYPNPFNPSTTISFSIPHLSFVTLRIYDLLGRETRSLVNEEKGPGTYSVMFDATALASGVYFYRLQTTGFVETKKLMVLR
jgi:hypothetical protein